jgi:hypothetical protein
MSDLCWSSKLCGTLQTLWQKVPGTYARSGWYSHISPVNGIYLLALQYNVPMAEVSARPPEVARRLD